MTESLREGMGRMSTTQGFYEAALAGIRDLGEKNPDYGPLLAYYGAVLEAQMETRALFHPEFDGPDVDAARKRISEGAPVLDPGDVRIDWRLFDDLFDRISRISRERAPTADEGVTSES